MSKEIEEMAKDICHHYEDCDICRAYNEPDVCDCDCWTGTYLAPKLYEKGYRKQEWVSVEERLPEREGKYLAYTIRGTIEMAGCYSYYVNDKPQFDYRITHWMPLPAPPKGGEGK